MSALNPTSGADDLSQIETELNSTFPLPSVRRIVHIALLTLVVGYGGLVLWSFITPIERAIIAPGVLAAEGRRKTVSLFEAGILREMVVRAGDHVMPGQTLFRLDVTLSQAAVEQARAQYWGGQAKLSRMRAEQAEQRSFTMPAEILAAAAGLPQLQEVVDTERRLFAARWEAYDGAVRVQERQIDALSATAAGFPFQRRAAERQLAAVQERLRGFGELARTGVGSRFRVLELQESEASSQSNLAGLRAQEAQTLQSIAQAQATLATLRLNRQQDTAKEMQAVAAEVAQAEQLLRSTQDVLSRRDVTAQEEGVVTNIQFFSPGSTIGAGAPVMELVPTNDRLVVEAKVQVTDIEQVVVGQRANVRLSAYRARVVPLIAGRVIYVAADQVSEPGQAPYFTVRLEMEQAELADLPSVHLHAGMPTENYILGDRRTLASYLTQPLRDSMRQSLRD